MPWGLKNSFSSSIRARIRRSFVLVDDREHAPARRRRAWPACGCWPRAPDGGRGTSRANARNVGSRSRMSSSKIGDRRQRQQADHRAHLEAQGAAVGEAQHVVEEAVLLVPHLVAGARRCGPWRRRSTWCARRTWRRTPRRADRAAPAPPRSAASAGCRRPSRRCRRPAPGSRRSAAASCGRRRRCCRDRGSRPRRRCCRCGPCG